ncbi:ABC transporter ATP-binding protein [Candidatus Micrarchaeota archaeon]|nr:ABC transporter ATP-binding protein [Candidatus Micrarchaeota archaeon]
MLKIKNLKKHFGGVKAVDGCTFNAERGKITALIGPNGAGKSTVFNIVSGILKPDSGSVSFGKKEIAGRSPEEISNVGISRLFQQTRLFKNLTVLENLLVAVDDEDEKLAKNLYAFENADRMRVKKARQTLKLFFSEEQANALEKKTASDLSYGQKRLVELTRTVLNPHELLMLDEPVAGVNPVLRKKIAGVLLELKKKGETILLIEHDMDFTLGISDRVVVMDEGRVIAEGTPREIKKNEKVLEAYLGE